MFNLVIHGIRMADKGTTRLTRSKKDQESIVSTLNKLATDINSHCIRDCFYLGKYET